LFVVVGLDLPCGSTDAVYVYDYSQGKPQRILESLGTKDHDESIPDILISKRDTSGNQSILTLRHAVQCGSSWNMLSYDLFLLSSTARSAVQKLGGEHGIWFGVDRPYQIRLEPDDLLMELWDRSVDNAIHSRAHVLHFKATSSKAERVDPVALQPHDFVDEWLTRPWAEMESRSAASGNAELKKWHQFLSGDFVSGDFLFVQQCREETDEWQIAVGMRWINGKELPEDLNVYFLVRQFGSYEFKMLDVSFERQEGCPGEAQPSSERQTLFPAR
jgi:hypothetical protein